MEQPQKIEKNFFAPELPLSHVQTPRLSLKKKGYQS